MVSHLSLERMVLGLLDTSIMGTLTKYSDSSLEVTIHLQVSKGDTL